MRSQEKQTEKIYGEMIYSLLNSFRTEAMALLRGMSNNLANVLATLKEVNASMLAIIANQKETREKRYEEEITELENRIQNLQTQLEQKKIDKTTSGKTTADIERIAQEQFTARLAEAEKTKEIETKTAWQKRKEAAITALIVSFSVALGWGVIQLLLPSIVALLQGLGK